MFRSVHGRQLNDARLPQPANTRFTSAAPDWEHIPGGDPEAAFHHAALLLLFAVVHSSSLYTESIA